LAVEVLDLWSNGVKENKSNLFYANWQKMSKILLSGNRGIIGCPSFFGKPFQEEVVLNIGDAIQQSSDWHRNTPGLSWLEDE
jgi:hypothetical protein